MFPDVHCDVGLHGLARSSVAQCLFCKSCVFSCVCDRIGHWRFRSSSCQAFGRLLPATLCVWNIYCGCCSPLNRFPFAASTYGRQFRTQLQCYALAQYIGGVFVYMGAHFPDRPLHLGAARSESVRSGSFDLREHWRTGVLGACFFVSHQLEGTVTRNTQSAYYLSA